LVGTYLSVQIGLSAALLFSSAVRLIGFFLFYRQDRPRKGLATPAPATPIAENPEE
jgi:hypothetical protein